MWKSILLIGTLTAGASADLVAQAVKVDADKVGATGRIGGRVVDVETGRPVTHARVIVVGIVGFAETDLDGRYRTNPVPVGLASARVAAIGYGPQRIDSIKVTDGQTTILNFAIKNTPVQLEELKVVSDVAQKASSAVGLLAAQQASPVVSDGISAETINRTPDSDASAAVTRVTGVSVLNDKVVVRGLAERYSSATLNGVEIASPEPDKKFVPLDVFPAELLEALVASKTATPDRPGDFAGGSLDVQTKEFPDNFTFTAKLTQSGNSRSTFKVFPKPPRGGSDFLGFNGSNRGFPTQVANQERYFESFSNVWTPADTKAGPNLGVDLSLGGRKDLGHDALGYVVSGTYGYAREFNPDKFSALSANGRGFLSSESAVKVDLAGIANLSYRLGTNHKFGIKNFYSRGSSDEARRAVGGAEGNIGVQTLDYQLRYTQRYVAQSQLTGDHAFGFLANSRLEWKGTYGWAGRDDLDNRRISYAKKEDGLELLPFNLGKGGRIVNHLEDRSWGGQADWSLPMSLRAPQDAQIKVGGSYRRKNRDFVDQRLEIDPQHLSRDLLGLPPELLMAPENLGPNGIQYVPGSGSNPYTGTDRVTAGYGMVDFELLERLRLVGGLRFERWYSAIDSKNVITSGGTSITERQQDAYLWSANLTYAMTDRINVRAAAYRTVVRPDLRELAPGGYAEVLGDCETHGNPSLDPSTVINTDLRFEVYPGANELFAVSGFYKRFKNPIVTATLSGGTDPFCLPVNGISANSYGLELEARKSLGFIESALGGFLIGANLTLLGSDITMPSNLGLFPTGMDFQGQSPYLFNLSGTYVASGRDLSASVLFNRYGQRFLYYGATAGVTSGRAADVVEEPRSTLDAKLKFGLWGGIRVALSGRNLLNTGIVYHNLETNGQRGILRYRSIPGVGVSVGLSYDYK